MRSSSTDPPQRADEAGPATGADGRTASRFLPDSRTGWLRLVIVVALGLAAVLGPPLVAQTGAVYTDRASVGGDVWTTPSFPPKAP